MGNTQLSKEILAETAVRIENLIDPEFGRKVLEFGSCTNSIAEYLEGKYDYLALTDKSADFPENFKTPSNNNEITLIPDSELGEDCYFGRFHLVYTIFGFHKIPHLVDEIMRLRRLILKGGKMAVIDFSEDNYEAECIKQLKRCGFQKINTETFELEGNEAFLICAEK